MVKIAICDDEENIRGFLSALTRAQDFESEIKVYSSAYEYLSADESFDILLLDIEMGAESPGINGMELAEKIQEKRGKQPLIIFITGYEKYVYSAFDVGAFQYLLKPVDERRFSEVIGRAVNEVMSSRERQNKTLEIRFADRKKLLPLNEIIYIESYNHKVIIHTRDRAFEYYAKIGDLENELQGGFFRIHKGYLVNLSYVDEYNRSELTLSNGESIFISKQRYSGFVKAYIRFMKEGGGRI